MYVMNMFNDLAQGFLFLPRGASYLASNRRLWPYAVLPFIINVFIVVVLAVLGVIFFSDLRSLVWSRPEAWYWVTLWYGFNALFAVVLIIALLVLFVLLLGIIAGPFNSKLALRTREYLRGERLNPAGGIYVDVFLPVFNEIRKFVLFTLVQLAALFLNIIPAIGNLAYVIVGGYLAFMFLAYAFLEYAVETEEWVTTIHQRLAYLRSRRWAALGFGAAVSLIFLIPVINFFLAPVAVVGAAMLYEHFGGQEGLPFHAGAPQRPQ